MMEKFTLSKLNIYRINPTYFDAVMNLAGVLSDQGRAEEAEVFYKKALSLEPENADAHNNYAVFMGKIGEDQEGQTGAWHFYSYNDKQLINDLALSTSR